MTAPRLITCVVLLGEDNPENANLGDMDAGPRDLLDVHVAAMDQAVDGQCSARARTLVIEGPLLALETMGLLVDYYRAGLRRRVAEGKNR
jgi:hypothetical protein